MTEVKIENCVVCTAPIFWANTHGRLAEEVPKVTFDAEPSKTEGGFHMKFDGKIAMTKQYVSKKKRIGDEDLYMRHRHTREEIQRAKEIRRLVQSHARGR